MKFGELIPVGILSIGMLFVTWLLLFGDTYADGFCTALGGEAINGQLCNVDGRVVEIK